MNKFQLIDKVLRSRLGHPAKEILMFLILKGDEEGRSWHPVSTLCQVAGIKHEKNFRGVEHYLPGLVKVDKARRNNAYIVNTPAVEGLSENEVVLKETIHRNNTPALEGVSTDNDPAVEGVSNTDTPATEGVSEWHKYTQVWGVTPDTPALEGVNTPATADNTPAGEGTKSTSNNTSKSTNKDERSATPPASPLTLEKTDVDSSSFDPREERTLNDESPPQGAAGRASRERLIVKDMKEFSKW